MTHYQFIRRMIVFLLPLVFVSAVPQSHAQDSGVSAGVPPRLVADYLHAVIQADRTLYATHVVSRMQDTGTVMASEGWKKRNTLPLPAQMLLLSGIEVKEQGFGLQFRLASLWPIYEKNGPTTKFETTGLEAVVKDPSQPYTGVITRGEKKYFKAIYADKAVSKACANCHNAHILSPKRDHKFGEVMGGIIISFPLESEKLDVP
ncbi:Tll0287-like domain-containing protein [Nitrospira sp. M1]